MDIPNSRVVTAVLFVALFFSASPAFCAKTMSLSSSFSIGDLGIYNATGIVYDSTDDKLWLCDSGGEDRIVQVPLTGGSIDQDFSYKAHGYRAPEGVTIHSSGYLVMIDIIADKFVMLRIADGSLYGSFSLTAGGVSGTAGITWDTTDDTRYIVGYTTRRLAHLDNGYVLTDSYSTGVSYFEGIAYDSTNDKLYAIDGVNDKIWHMNTDATGGSSTDLGALGIDYATGVTRRASDGHLFISDLGATPEPKEPKVFELDSSYNVINSFTLHAENLSPTDIAYHPTNQQIYVLNNATNDAIYVYNTAGVYQERHFLGKMSSEGLCVNENDNLIILEFGGDIAELTTGFALVAEDFVEQSVPTNGSGISFTGSAYCVADYMQKEIFLTGATGITLTSFDTEGFGCDLPEGVMYDSVSGNIFIIDSDSDRLYEVSTGGVMQNSYDMSAFGVGAATGVTLKGGESDVFVVDIVDDTVYRFSITEEGGNMDLAGPPMTGSITLIRPGVETFDGGTLFGYNTQGAGPVEVVDLGGNNVAEIIEGITPGDLFPPEGSGPDYSPDRSINMYSRIYVPVLEGKLTFSFMMGEFDETDYFSVYFLGDELLTLTHLDKTGDFQTIEIDLSGYGGATGILSFYLAGEGDDTKPDVIWLDDISLSGVPEPGTIAMITLGALGILGAVRARRK